MGYAEAYKADMSWHDQPWRLRYQKLGDEAEAVYLEALPLGKSDRFGWRRPDVHMKNMTAKMRHMPDYYAEQGWLVEVMGCGKDLTLKLKDNKYRSLLSYHRDQPTCLFAWNSHIRQWLILTMPEVKRAVQWARSRRGVASFHDGQDYYPLLWSELQQLASHHGS